MSYESYNLFSQKHYSDICTCLKKCFEEEKNMNVTFLCKGNREVRAHKLVLSRVSPFLKSLFLQDEHTTITLPDVELKTMNILLVLLYEGSVKFTPSELKDFTGVLELLQIKLPQSLMNQLVVFNTQSVNTVLSESSSFPAVDVSETLLSHFASTSDSVTLKTRKKSVRVRKAHSHVPNFSPNSTTPLPPADILPVFKPAVSQRLVDRAPARDQFHAAPQKPRVPTHPVPFRNQEEEQDSRFSGVVIKQEIEDVDVEEENLDDTSSLPSIWDVAPSWVTGGSAYGGAGAGQGGPNRGALRSRGQYLSVAGSASSVLSEPRDAEDMDGVAYPEVEVKEEPSQEFLPGPPPLLAGLPGPSRDPQRLGWRRTISEAEWESIEWLENIRKKNREAMRRRRQRIRGNPELFEEMKERVREDYHKRRGQGRIRAISDLSPMEQSRQRAKWREYSNKYREKKRRLMAQIM